MDGRVTTLVCTFDARSPRTSAFQIHEWVHFQLRLTEPEMRMIQIDGSSRRVYIKFVDKDHMYAVLKRTGGVQEYKHESGEISVVTIEVAGMGIRKVRIANLPPEQSDAVIGRALLPYGEVKSVSEERWARHYRFGLSNGIRVVELNLRRHVPSRLFIGGHRVQVSYDGQPFTCYGCSEEGHTYSECPRRRTRPLPARSSGAVSWSEMVQSGRSSPTLAGVESNLLFDGEEMERTRTDQTVVLPVTEVSPTLSTGLAPGLTQDAGGDETTPPVVLPAAAAAEDITTDVGDLHGAAAGADVPLEDAGVSVLGGDRPSWNVLVAEGDLLVEEVPDVCAAMAWGPPDTDMDCGGEVMTAAGVRVGDGGPTCADGATAVGVEQSAARPDSARRKVSISDDTDGASQPPFRPVSPTKPKKLKVERAPPPTRTRSQAHSRFKL
jgi:hypothetical protein